jgi:hypothetical protein
MPACQRSATLDYVAKEGHAATTIFNLLELCGILSFNLNDEQAVFRFPPLHPESSWNDSRDTKRHTSGTSR